MYQNPHISSTPINLLQKLKKTNSEWLPKPSLSVPAKCSALSQQTMLQFPFPVPKNFMTFSGRGEAAKKTRNIRERAHKRRKCARNIKAHRWWAFMFGLDYRFRVQLHHFIFTRKKKESGFSPFSIFGVTVNFTLPFSGAAIFSAPSTSISHTTP